MSKWTYRQTLEERQSALLHALETVPQCQGSYQSMDAKTGGTSYCFMGLGQKIAFEFIEGDLTEVRRSQWDFCQGLQEAFSIPSYVDVMDALGHNPLAHDCAGGPYYIWTEVNDSGVLFAQFAQWLKKYWALQKDEKAEDYNAW